MKRFGFIIIAAVLAILIILAIPRNNSFRYTDTEILEEIQKRTYIVSVGRYKEMIADQSNPSTIVDLRPAGSYDAAHLPEAVNFPSMKGNIKSLHELFGNLQGHVFLYANRTSTACEWWILLSKMGFDGLYVLETGTDLDQLIQNWDQRQDRNIIVDEIPTRTSRIN
jgi:hypothetical protein